MDRKQKMDSKSNKQSFTNEVMLHHLSHPNMVTLYEAFVDPKHFFLEMELCAGGDIFSHLSTTGRFSEDVTRHILSQLLDVVQYFHDNDVVHRDLKPENIVFVAQNDSANIRLIDFGETIHVEADRIYDDFGVSYILYMSLSVLCR